MIRDKNHHCTVVQICNFGILIKGASGAGKSCLAMGLIEQSQRLNWPAFLVSDDQAFLEPSEGNAHLIATAPKTIQGKIELHGYGIVEANFIEHAKINLVVELVDQAEIERMPQSDHVDILEISVPLILTPRQHEAQGVRIVTAWIKARVNA